MPAWMIALAILGLIIELLKDLATYLLNANWSTQQNINNLMVHTMQKIHDEVKENNNGKVLQDDGKKD
jgi:hypothetical protein